MKARKGELNRSALRLMEQLGTDPRPVAPAQRADADRLIRHELAVMPLPDHLVLTEAGAAFLKRKAHDVQQRPGEGIDGFRAQHLSLSKASPAAAGEPLFDEGESPLLWLARRKGADGRPLIEPHQFQAGERLRATFTMAQMMPSVTVNWQTAGAGRQRGGSGGGEHMTDRVVAARQRMHLALDAVGPEFSGLLMDVCCFLKKLDEIERERRWPARSAKVVLQLALEKLARHFGYQSEARGRDGAAALQVWTAEDPASPP